MTTSASYSVNIDYTSLGRVEVKIQVMADDHEQALKTAQHVLNQQKSWLKKNKEGAKEEQAHYKKLLHFGPDYDSQSKHIEASLAGATNKLASDVEAANQFLQSTMAGEFKSKDNKGIM